MSRIGDAFYGVHLDDADLQREAQAAGQGAGKSFGSSMQAGIQKTFSSGALKQGLMQGLGLGGGLLAANAVADAVGGIKDAIVGTIDSALRFEQGLRNVNSIAKVTDQELASMGDSALEIGGNFGQSAQTMIDALYDINSSGFEGAQALDVLEASALAATAGMSTTGEAAAGITAVLNAYGMSAQDAGRVSDVMFKTVERGVVTFSELSGAIGTTTALSAPLGVSLEEVAAGLAVMTRSGIDAENSTTQLNAIMASMLKPSAEAAELAKKLGLQWNAAGLRAKGLTGILSEMVEKTNGNQEAMATLLGDARAIRGAFVLAADGGKEFNDELEIMQNSAGAAGEAFGEQSKGAAFKLAQMQSKLEAAGIEIGQKFLPILVELSDVVIDVVIPALQGVADVLGLLQGKIPESTVGLEGLVGFLNGLNPATWGFNIGMSGIRQKMEEAAAQAEETQQRTAAATAHMADASKDDLYQVEQAAGDTATAIGTISTAADDAKLAVDISFDDITASFKAMRDVIVGGGSAVAAALYDPIIAQQELLNTQEEIRANKKKIRDKATTDEERRQLEARNTQLQKSLIEQNALILTYGTEAEQTSKIKAFLASDFWVQAYEEATPEQAAALDDWRTTLQDRLNHMEGDATEGGRNVKDNYKNQLAGGKGEVTTATDTMVSGMGGAFDRAAASAYRYGQNLTVSYSNGLTSKSWYLADAAGGLGRIINKYLKISSPAELGPLSEDGGPGAWGERGGEVYAEGWATALRKAYQSAAALAGGVAAGLGLRGPQGAMVGAYAAPSAGAVTLPSMGVPGAGPVVTKNIEYHIHAEGQLKVRDPLAAANLLARFQGQGMLPEDPDA